MQDAMSELNDLLNSYSSVAMRVMDCRGFEQYFGRILAAVGRFRAQPRDQKQSEQLVSIASLLLERAVDHHGKGDRYATSDAVAVYDEIVRLLFEILRGDLQMFESVYEDAQVTSLFLNAVRASGINPPGYSANRYTSRYSDKDEVEASRTKALGYAQERIEEFTRFVYNLDRNNQIYDPFQHGDRSAALSLFKRVRSLRPGGEMLECQP